MKIDGIWSLHRYFIWADRMRVHFEECLDNKIAMGGEIKTLGDSMEVLMYPYMAYWYSGMYVVVEGWRDLKLTDEKIDKLLESENVCRLKRFRNGSFHFQKNYFSKKFFDFMPEDENTAKWIRELRNEFSRFFLEHEDIRDPEFKI